MKYDIFISYRRESGEQSAKAIYDRLTDKGYNVFLDVETLRSGAFNEKLYSVIEECRDVLVILSPNALDRCINEDDWVRLEVAHAIKCKKNVVPIMLRGFDFPPELPADIETLRYQNGIQASVEFFDAFLEKLYRFLKSKPGFIRRFLTSLSWRRSLIAVAICLLLVPGVWGGSILIRQMFPSAYPVTQKQKNDVRNMLYYIQMNLTIVDNMLVTYQDALKACEDYLHEPSASSYKNLASYLQHSREVLKQEAQQAMPLSKELSESISQTKINIAELTAFSQFPKLLEYDREIAFMEFAMNPANPLDNAIRFRLITIDRDLATLDAQSIMVGICQLLLSVDEKALKEFRSEHLPLLSVISKELSLWSRDETDLQAKEKNIVTQQQNLMQERASLVGKQNMELQSAKKILEKKEQSFREKFAPKDTDVPYQVWAKALVFLRAKMYDDAVNTFQFFLNKFKDIDLKAEVYVPSAIKFVRSINKTGIDYGSLVIGYEPGKPSHPVIQVGDIIVAVNKSICYNFADYEKLTKLIPENSSYQVTVLRQDKTGMLKKIDVQIPSGNLTKVALVNLKEMENPVVTPDPLAGKKEEIAEKKEELAEAQKRLAEKKQSLREKFRPQETDDPYLVWGKALRFLQVRMYDDAVNAFQFYLNKVKDTDPEALVYVPAAINFVRSISKTGIDYGVLVVGYEPGKPHHPVYKVGDIVVAINKTICRRFADYNRIIGSIPMGAGITATILRPDEKDGQLRLIDVEFPRGGSKVALMELTEGD